MKTSDITIVLQGSVKAYAQRDAVPFARILKRTREALPGATIIVSTWEGTDLPGSLPIDALVLSKDPGPLAPLKLTDFKSNNINRQIVSTQAGMRAVRTPYAVKLRTDCYLEHASFIDYYETQLRRDKRAERIVTSSFFTLDTAVFERIPYHVSDWFQFAPTEVLQAYWDAPLMSAAAGRFYENQPHVEGSNVFERRFRAEFAVEQHVGMHYAKRLGYTCPRYLNDTSGQVLRDYHRFLSRELLVLDPWQSGLVFPKYSWVNASVLQGINNFMHLDWLALTGEQSFDENQEAESLKRLLAQRRRLKEVANWLFLISSPFHGLMFEQSLRGRFMRRQLMRAFRILRGIARA